MILRPRSLANWITAAVVVLCCTYPSWASANDDIDIVCPCTVEFSNLTSVSFSFGIRNLKSSSDTGPLSAQLRARELDERWEQIVASLDLPSVAANSTRRVQEYTTAFRMPWQEGTYELSLELRAEGGRRLVESVTWLVDPVELKAGGTAQSSVFLDGTPTIEFGEDSATVKLPVVKNGVGGTQADGLKLVMGTHASLTGYPSRIAEHDLGKDLSPGSQTGAATIKMSFEAGSLRDYVSILIVNSDNRTILQEIVSVTEGEELPKREFATNDASLLVDSDDDGVGDVNEGLEGTDPDDAESTPSETTLDVLGLYFPSVAELYGGDPTTRLRHVLNLASIIFQDSGAGVKLRLVGMREVQEDALDDYEFLDGLAEQYGADMAVLFWDFLGPSCGWAPLGGLHSNGVISFSQVPVANVVAPCGAGTTAHEIGHVMGLGHSVIQRGNAETGTFRWARGHGVFQIFGTVMTYNFLYGGAPVLEVFSDPDRDCRGLPCGSAVDQTDGADAVAALNATRFQIARIGEAKPDSDNDGVVDPVDAFPNDPGEHSDNDSDGIGDKVDDDDDGDGVADVDDLFPLDSLDWADTDSDGVGDNTDAFPNDPDEAFDRDGDGVGDNTDLFPDDPLDSVDTDNDGVGNNRDTFPFDTREWLDTDGDGVGDNADLDADNDGVADTHDVFPLDAARTDASSYRIQLANGATQRISLSSAGDVDDDGRADVLIGTVHYDSDEGRWSSAAYLIAAADLEAADEADGAVDRVVEVERIANQPGSWKFVGEGERTGYSVATVGDIGSDGVPEILIGAPYEREPDDARRSGAAYLVSPPDLPAADAADGTTDGVVDLANIAAQANSWKFVGEGAGEQAGTSVGPVGDLNGDNVADLVIGAPGNQWSEDPSSGAAYLISGEDLQDADSADGDEDGVIHLAHIASQPGSWKLTGELAGDYVGSIAPSTYLDEDGNKMLIVHAPDPSFYSERSTGAVYLIAVSELSAADSDDGLADGVVNLARAALRPESWQLVGREYNRAQHAESIGDHDGDGIVDVVVRDTSMIFFLSGTDFRVADESDGSRDGVILLREMEAPNSWTSGVSYLDSDSDGFAGGQVDGDALEDLILLDGGTTYLLSGRTLADNESTGDLQLNQFAGDEGSWQLGAFPDRIAAIAIAGDVDSDGNEDLLLGGDGWVFLIMAEDLHVLDSADDSKNGIIDLGQTTGDSDQDGIDNILDADDDNDGFPDFEDRFPRDVHDWADRDRDGVGDNTDAFPDDWREQFDTDADGIGDRADTDDDGDGIDDDVDEYPLDTDNDATDNRADLDDDDDGIADTQDAFPFDSAESGDFDRDGIGDNADTDDDNDGVLDTADAFPNDAAESADTDSDGVGDNIDAFVSDGDESIDTDGDGQGNNADTDDDNDGTLDATDAFPLDAAESADADGDGVGDNGDAFPQNSSEWADTDGDGVGDNTDTDDDNDGYTDGADFYPLDANRQQLFIFRLSGEHKGSLFGQAITAAGDVDSDGLVDLLVGAPGARGSGQEHGEVHVVSGSTLVTADQSDGMRDGLVALGEIAAQPGHWAVLGKRYDDFLGGDLFEAGDIGSDGKPNWILGASGRNNSTAAAYVVSPDDLVAVHPAGSRDGGTSIAAILGASGSWELTADGRGHDYAAGAKVSRIEDTDGDGKPELLIGTPWHSEDYRPGASVPGAAFLVSSAHLLSSNAASTSDGSRIDLSDLSEKSGAWKFLGEGDGDRAGASVTSVGDIDGDGLADFAIGAYGHTVAFNNQGAIYLIAAADLESADQADGQADRVIRLAKVHSQSSSWKIVGEYENATVGFSVVASDINGDGKAELVITSAKMSDGTATGYVLPLSQLAEADSADGASDRVISLGHVASLENAWKLLGEVNLGRSVSYFDFNTSPRVTAADINGDGVDELIVGIPDPYRDPDSSTVVTSSSSYVISGADFASADAADGQSDGAILLANVVAQENSWKFVDDSLVSSVSAPGDLNGDGVGELVLGTTKYPLWDSYGMATIVSGAELVQADRQDGVEDGVINLGAMPDWYRSVDFDLDGIEDAIDTDDDNDGVADSADAFPHDPAEALDSDHDGIGNNADPDDDNDGTEDSADAFPFDPYEIVDSDSDGVGDNADTDDDNDGVSDEEDAFPLDFYESVDSDGDGIGDNIDPDDDNDGVPDEEDKTPRGSTGYLDSDGEGIANSPDFAGTPDLYFYRLRGESLTLGEGDFDGDGLADIVIGSASAQDTAWLVSAADIADADDADGARDHAVDLDRVSSLKSSWKLSGVAGTRRIWFAGDVDSDGRDDMVVSGRQHTYLIPMSSMNAADAADGRSDRAITLGDKLVGSTVGAWRLAGTARESGIFSLADVNGDGRDELLIGAPWISGPAELNTAYVASGSDWSFADGLDGSEDGMIDLDRLVRRPGSFKVVAQGGSRSGASISHAGDVDGDGYADLMISTPGNLSDGLPNTGVVHLLSGRSMASLDGRDGTADGIIQLSQAGGVGLWQFTGQDFGTEHMPSTAGDVDGDGLADLIIAGQHSVYLIAGSDIAAADAADGAPDRAIEVANAVAQPGSYQFTAGVAVGSGLRVLGVGDFDRDAMDDILVVRRGSSFAHLIAAKDFGALDAANGIVNVSGISPLPNSWVLEIEGTEALFDGTAFSADLNGDGRPELIVGTHASGNATSRSAYVISSAQLATADSLDGVPDRSITLDSITNP